MSNVISKEVSCPSCSHTGSAHLYISINASNDPQFKKALLPMMFTLFGIWISESAEQPVKALLPMEYSGTEFRADGSCRYDT